jgi:uncharacterized repeat protein (TIGR02543 family)
MKTIQKIFRFGGALLFAIEAGQCGGGIGEQQTDTSNQVFLQVTSDNSLGTVASDDGQIDCGTVCGATYEPGTQVTLTATPAPGTDATFEGWGGACSGTQPSCTVTVEAGVEVSASWKRKDRLPDQFPAPTVTAVSPAAVVNNVAQTLTISGTDFRAGATVKVGGVDCTQATVVSATQITCNYPGKAVTCGGQDIVVTNTDDNQSGSLAAAKGVKLLSSGLGFGAAASYALGNGPRLAAMGDWNGDQKIDIVIPIANDNKLSLLTGKGDGTFNPQANFAVGTGPQAALAGDVNGI